MIYHIGKTAFKWDRIIDISKLWEQYKRIIKDDGIICLFSIDPFTSLLINSSLDLFRYKWIWKKDTATGHLNSNYKPLNITEDICIFSKSKVGSMSKNPIRFYPQNLIEINIKKRNNPNSNWRKNKGYNSKNNILNSNKPFIQKYTGYPNNILEYSRDKKAIHPTQKPVKLLEYLIKTYTKENENVLDNCMGSGSTAIACINTNRNFIGMELNRDYYQIASKRIYTRIY